MDWHTRFQQQAGWTHSLRQHLYERYNVAGARRILDVGCGTGVLLTELTSISKASLYGIDINPEHIIMSMRNSRSAFCSRADAFRLPFSKGTFDIVLCHYVLLWLANPLAAIMEMLRVTRSGGCILALAEPDYGSRLDYPSDLSVLGSWQQDALRMQGADPLTGRKLAHLFYQAGLGEIEAGVLGAQWRPAADLSAFELEWQVLMDDLKEYPERLASALQLRDNDRQATIEGWRILFVPTFYAVGVSSAPS